MLRQTAAMNAPQVLGPGQYRFRATDPPVTAQPAPFQYLYRLLQRNRTTAPSACRQSTRLHDLSVGHQNAIDRTE